MSIPVVTLTWSKSGRSVPDLSVPVFHPSIFERLQFRQIRRMQIHVRHLNLNGNQHKVVLMTKILAAAYLRSGGIRTCDLKMTMIANTEQEQGPLYDFIRFFSSKKNPNSRIKIAITHCLPWWHTYITIRVTFKIKDQE